MSLYDQLKIAEELAKMEILLALTFTAVMASLAGLFVLKGIKLFKEVAGKKNFFNTKIEKGDNDKK